MVNNQFSNFGNINRKSNTRLNAYDKYSIGLLTYACRSDTFLWLIFKFSPRKINLIHEHLIGT